MRIPPSRRWWPIRGRWIRRRCSIGNGAARSWATGAPFELDQNRKVCDFIRSSIYRGVNGTLKFFQKEQAAIPYPSRTNDPSLGMPHQFLQVQDYREDPVLISPEPYTTGEFKLPWWLA